MILLLSIEKAHRVQCHLKLWTHSDQAAITSEQGWSQTTVNSVSSHAPRRDGLRFVFPLKLEGDNLLLVMWFHELASALSRTNVALVVDAAIALFIVHLEPIVATADLALLSHNSTSPNH